MIQRNHFSGLSIETFFGPSVEKRSLNWHERISLTGTRNTKIVSQYLGNSSLSETQGEQDWMKGLG